MGIVVALFSKCSSKVNGPVRLYVKRKNCKNKRGYAREDIVHRVFFSRRELDLEKEAMEIEVRYGSWKHMKVDFASTKEKCREKQRIRALGKKQFLFV